MNEIAERINALQTELNNAPTWKVTTSWYTDREAEIALLRAKMESDHRAAWEGMP